jgi:glycerol-3-phosphate dehydrogenase (NAD(P)+)
MRVTVLGAGSWGTTVASLVSGKNDAMVWAWEPEVAREIAEAHTNERYLPGFRLPERLQATADLQHALARSEVLTLGMPSHVFRGVIERAAPYVPSWIPVVSLAKGLEPGSLLRMTQVVKEVLPGHPAAALTGPNVATEIMAGKPAATVLATPDLTVARALQDVFSRRRLRVYMNQDVIGCEVGGALKNVITIAVGMAQGLGVGDNTRATLITRGLAELTRLGIAMGGQALTFAGLAGMGDLIATCISPHSRNRHVGEQLGMGRKLDDILSEMTMVAEGVRTAASAVELADRYSLDLPISRAVHQVVIGATTAFDAFEGLWRTPAGEESEPA